MYFKQDTFFIAELRGTFVPFAPLKAKSLKKKKSYFHNTNAYKRRKGELDSKKLKSK